MRRSIMVFGCTSARVHPDHSVSITDSKGIEEVMEGKWVSYVPRFN